MRQFRIVSHQYKFEKNMFVPVRSCMFRINDTARQITSKYPKRSIHLDNSCCNAISNSLKVLVTDKDQQEFMAAYSNVVKDITATPNRLSDVPAAAKRYVKFLDYNVLKGLTNVGPATVSAYKLIEKPGNLTPEKMRKAITVGWCAEMLRACLGISDDIADGAEIRNGIQCWYRKEDVRLNALNDGFVLENDVYSVLGKNLRHEPFFTALVEVFHDVAAKALMGRIAEDFTQRNGKPKLDKYTMESFNAIAMLQTGYENFYLPVGAAMCLSGIGNNEDLHKQAKQILLDIGVLIHVQNDYLECFGTYKLIHDNGADIRNGKCTWLAVKAMELANGAQKRKMQTYYGKKDLKGVEIIRSLYEELNIPQHYAEYQKKSYTSISAAIKKYLQSLPQDLFFKMTDAAELIPK